MIIHRLPDWEARLSALLMRVHDRPFEYGKFDCGQFARLAIQEMTGIDLGSGSQRGYCDPVSAGLLLRRSGANDMSALAEIIAGLNGIAEIDPNFAKRGDIVLAKGSDGPGLAVVIDDFALAPSPECNGIGRVPRQNWLRAWRTEHISPQTNIGELFAAVDGPLAFLVPILISTILSFAVSAIGSVISKAFIKKPKKSPLSFEDRTITIRQSIEPWHAIIGSARVGGDIFFFDKIGTSPTEDIWLGIEWAHHPCMAIDSIYADNEQIFVNADGSVEGVHNGFLEVFHHLGADPETANVALMTAFPLKWTAAHRGDGITYSIFHFVDLGTNWAGAIPNMTADIRGELWIDPRTGIRAYTDNLAVVAYGLLMDKNFGEGAPATEIDTSNFIAQANVCDEEIDLPAWTEHWKITLRHLTSFTVNTSTNVITILSGKTFFTPDKIYVYADTTLAAPLLQQTVYFYRRITATTGTLHPTATDASNNTNIIDLTTTGTGTQRMILAASTLEMLGKETTFTVNTTTDVLTMADHISVTIDQECLFQSTGTLPAPLVAGQKYDLYNTDIAAPATANVNAFPASSAIDFTTIGTGTHTVRLLGSVTLVNHSIDINTTSDQISLTSDSLIPRIVGTPLRVVEQAAGIANPLQNGMTVYMIPIDSTHIKLAESRKNAEAGIAIDLTSTGSQNFWFESLEINQDEMLGVTTGMVVQVSAVDALPGNFIAATDYYFIRRGRGIFQIAASLSDALSGINLEIKPTNGSTIGSNRCGVNLKRERRYTANGVIDTDQDTLDIEKALGACCAGTLLEPLGSGKWRLKVGAYPIPLGMLQLKHVRQDGQPELQCLIEGSETAATVKGTYSAPLNFDHPSDIPAMSDPVFIEEDGGEEHILDVQYPFTNSKFMARRIAKIDLRRKRMQRTLRLPVTLPAGFKYEYGDGVHIDLSPLPIKFDAEISGWSFNTKSEGEGVPKPSIDLILRETDPWIYR